MTENDQDNGNPASPSSHQRTTPFTSITPSDTDDDSPNYLTEPCKVYVCNGPTCKSLGSNDVLKTLNRRAAKGEILVEIIPQNCFSRCEKSDALCPCVRVEDTWIVKASPQAVIREIQS